MQQPCTTTGMLCFSSTVTCHPALAIKQAADKPAKPLPITMVFFMPFV
jgi:hypothetical protein